MRDATGVSPDAAPFIAAALAGLCSSARYEAEEPGTIAERAIAIGEATAAKLAAKREAANPKKRAA